VILVFGSSISTLLSRNDTVDGIPFVVKTIVEFLLSGDNPKTEGLFRVSGNAAHVKEVKNFFERGSVQIHFFFLFRFVSDAILSL
jgi:hypothetical protein